MLMHIKKGEETVPVGDNSPVPMGGFNIGCYDNLVMTYNGNGDVETVTYFYEGAQLAMLTLGYDPISGKLTSVTKS